MRTALVADWLTVFGGAEHVIIELTKLWPNAPLYTTVARPEKLGPLSDRDIRTTSLQRWYRLIGRHQPLLPLMPRAIEGIDLNGYDLIVSSSHAVAKGIVPPSSAVHVCYCHTPMRYAWEMENEYLEDFRIPAWLRGAVKRQLERLRRWDLTTAKRVDTFIANSTETQERIARIYARDSIVIPPPVSDHFLEGTLIDPHERAYYLAIGRLVPYKRFDLLIDTANALRLPLKIAGTGQEFARLKAMAGPTVELLGYVSDGDLPSLYGNAKALLFPQYEDAGIVPIEAQACGTPVLAYARGGARDSITEETGVFFSQQHTDALREAIDRFQVRQFDPQHLREHARQFSATRFRERVSNVAEEALKKNSM